MRDSNTLLCRRGPARGEQVSTGALHSDGSEPLTSQIIKATPKGCGFYYLAEDEGFEPPQTESESGVLPLHKSSMLALTVLLYAKKSKCQVLFLKNFIFLFRSLLPWPGSACQNHFFQISEGLLFSLFRQHGQHKTQLPPCFRVHQRLFL